MERKKHTPREPEQQVSDVVLAEQYRNEARELLAETHQTMAKIQRFNDLSMSNQRQLILAMSNLLPRPIVSDFDVHFEDENEAMADFAQDMATTLKQREVFDVIHSINVLAMANTNVLHVFTNFSGHVNEFSAHANSADVDYEEDFHLPRLMNERVYLHKENALEKLLSIESQLTELIIEAREQAEAKAEVTHG